MKNKSKKIAALALALMMVLSLVACGDKAPVDDAADVDSDKVYTVTVELNYPEPAAGVLTTYFNDLEQLSNGRLDFDIYYGMSLSGESGILDTLQSGVTQVIGFMPYTQETLFPYSGALFGLPFLGCTDIESTADIWWEMYNTTPEMQAEYERAGLTVISSIANPIYDLHFKDANVDVRVPSDLKGMSIITSVPEIQRIVSDAGAAPIEAAPGDYYSNLDKGVAEGIIQHINILTSFGVNPEILGTHVRFEKGGGGFATSIMQVIWSTDFLNSLPADLQEIINKRSATLQDEILANDAALVEQNYKLAEEKGATIIYLNEEEVQQWKDAAASVTTEALQDYVDEGATEMINIYNKLMKTIEDYYSE